MLRIDFVTLFPESIRPFLSHSILGRAQEQGLVQFGFANPRDFTYDRHQKVDDTPFGGEPGMLLKAEPVALAIESLDLGLGAAIILPEPAAPLFSQSAASALAGFNQLVFVCGHYEGIDHRIRAAMATHAFSIGDFVLTNGEMPSLVMADAITRLLPGVLGTPESLEADSFSDGLLAAPNFTRPETWRGLEAPPVLLSGNHGAVQKWRRAESLRLTRELRPDLLSKATLSKRDLEELS